MKRIATALAAAMIATTAQAQQTHSEFFWIAASNDYSNIDKIPISEAELSGGYPIDGDTVKINGSTVRMAFIDAPEKPNARGQDNGMGHGQRGWQGSEMAIIMMQSHSHHVINCPSRERGYYGRRISECFLGKTNIGLELVKRGWAWSLPKSGPYHEAMIDACSKRLGIWRDDFVITPKDWRDGKRQDVQPRPC